VQVYVACIRRICADLLAVGISASDDEVVPALLADLSAAYGMLVTVIESSEEELTVAAVVTKLLNTKASVAREEAAEAHVAAPPRFTPRTETRTCYYCGLQRDCRAHIRAEQNSSQAKALMAGLGVSSSTAWLVDSGASHHVCSDRTLFNNLRASDVKSVMTANHGIAPVKGQEYVQLRVSVHSSNKVVEVRDVLYVPGLSANLLSVGKLADPGMPVAFVQDQCVVGPVEAPLFTAIRREGLFCLNVEPASAGKFSDEGLGAVFATLLPA
jgi:hypothetical protein